MPSNIRIIDNDEERAKQNHATMGGEAEKVKLREKLVKDRQMLDNVFGPGPARYNHVPLPEFYMDAEWEEAHRDNIEENLKIAEMGQVVDVLASPKDVG